MEILIREWFSKHKRCSEQIEPFIYKIKYISFKWIKSYKGEHGNIISRNEYGYSIIKNDIWIECEVWWCTL
jgi:hypothetical protein